MKVARSGDAEAKARLGKLYLFGGEGLAANETAALHWLSQAAREGLAEANVLIAECVARGSIGPDVHQYKSACERAAEQGHPVGYCALGDIYTSQSAEVVNLDKARDAYRQAAQSGHLGAATKLGLLLADHAQQAPIPKASSEAVRWLRLAADAGDPEAANNLGKLLWRSGDSDAVLWLEPEARRGNPEAMYCMGEILCRQGDKARAGQGAYWLERAARSDHPLALWLYGRMHVRQLGGIDYGLPHSPLQAARLLERAAALGVSKALWDLARIYEMPRYSRRDPGRARQCLEQAANAGVAEAQLELGRRLSRYKKDHGAWIAAGRWLSSASDGGSSEARSLIAHIADFAEKWPEATEIRQEQALVRIRDTQPTLAARLELAGRFGLSTRETLYVQPTNLDRGWCIEVDLTRHFKRKSWRLVKIETADQQLALERARQAFLAPGSASLDLSAANGGGRARQLKSLCARHKIDPALFLRDWNAQ